MIKFIIRFLLWFSLWLLILLPLQLVGSIILLMVLPFNRNQTLPVCLKWFDNADHWVGRDTSVIDAICAAGWWSRYCYIAWRNPLNYFGYKVLGLTIHASIWQTDEKTILFNKNADPVLNSVGDSTSDYAGVHYGEFLNGTHTVFEYYAVLPYTLFGKLKCFRFRIGHKLGHFSDMHEGQHVQFCFIISPFHSFSGKV